MALIIRDNSCNLLFDKIENAMLRALQLLAIDIK